jgi:glycosyltransferase involved in cell wall biosynthesis
MEAKLWNKMNVYNHIDSIICCSEFMKSKLDTNPVFKNKTITIHNFTTKAKLNANALDTIIKENYVLYFGRYSQEKGVETLLQACKELPQIPFVFAGSGSLEIREKINSIPNIKEVGFLSGDKLNEMISKAKFSIYPSEWYENCPFSIIESQMLGTPVLGANIGGIPELIDPMKTGLLFESGNKANLINITNTLYANEQLLKSMTRECLNKDYMDIDIYCDKLLKIYKGEM